MVDRYKKYNELLAVTKIIKKNNKIYFYMDKFENEMIKKEKAAIVTFIKNKYKIKYFYKSLLLRLDIQKILKK